jgi:3-polyprenyl-4-hydroxybenzoate decarboxylase
VLQKPGRCDWCYGHSCNSIPDHATSEMAIGSKLGIDATKKLPGEGEDGKAVQASLKRWVIGRFNPNEAVAQSPRLIRKRLFAIYRSSGLQIIR